VISGAGTGSSLACIVSHKLEAKILGVVDAPGFPTGKLVFVTEKRKSPPSLAKRFRQFLLARGMASFAIFVPFADPGLGGDH